MKPGKMIIVVGIFSLLTLNSFSQTNWVISDDYEISFAGTKAEGTFRGLEGKIQFSPDQLDQSVFDVSVDVSTISTGNNTKNKHARGESWFFADKFPKIRFKTSEIVQEGENYVATGTLDMRGVKKEITLPFTFSQQDDTGKFIGTMKVNREDFGIEGNFFGFVVGEEFEVNISIPVSQ